MMITETLKNNYVPLPFPGIFSTKIITSITYGGCVCIKLNFVSEQFEVQSSHISCLWLENLGTLWYL